MMKQEELFQHCGFSYVLTFKEGKVKGVKPASGSTNPSLGKNKVEDYTLDMGSFTEFERSVMKKAMEIPKGKVATYGGLANAAGRPKAVRAVGNAMARNPIPIIVPCHRVIKSDRTIGGYAYGNERKMAILKAEGVAFDGQKVKEKYLHRF